MSQRTDRVDELLRQEIGGDRRRGTWRIRGSGSSRSPSVETTPDLRHAKVWVSVIGQPAERDATVAALGRAMPFVRHELGKRLRLKRIPDLHVQLDDTAERGTRVLQLLDELEAGAVPGRDRRRSSRRCRRPVARLPHEGDLADEPPSAVLPVKPRRRRRTYHKRGPAGRDAEAPMTVDLTPYLDAVPDVGRRAAARRAARARRRPREPRRGHARGRARRSSASSRRWAATADAVCTRPVAAAVRLPARRRARPDRPGSGAPTTTSS